jgi:MFS family permease
MTRWLATLRLRPVPCSRPLRRAARRPAEYYRQLPASVRLLSAGALVNTAGGFVTMFLTLILAIRNISPTRIAIALIASSAFAVAGAWLGGALISRMPGKKVIFLSMTGSALFTAGLIPAGPYPVTLVIVCLIALCNRAYVPAATTLIGSSSGPGQRMRIFSFFQVSLNVGAAVGPAVAGFLLTRSLTALLLIDAVTSAAFALVATRLPDDVRSADHRPADGERARHNVRHDRRYLMFCGGAVLVAVAYAQQGGSLPIAFRDQHYSLELLGYLLSGNAIAVIIFQLPMSFLTQQLDIRVPLALGAAAIGGGYGLLLAGFSAPMLVASVALWTAGELAYAPAAPTVAMMMSSSGTRGAYQGMLYAARTAGQTLGPALGVLAYSVGASVPWLGCGALGSAAAGLLAVAVRPDRPSEPDDDRARVAAGGGADAPGALPRSTRRGELRRQPPLRLVNGDATLPDVGYPPEYGRVVEEV